MGSRRVLTFGHGEARPWFQRFGVFLSVLLTVATLPSCVSASAQGQIVPSDLAGYAAALRAADNLAHSTTEVPPGANLRGTAYALAVSRKLNLGYGGPSPSQWKALIGSSGENELWSAYYLCLGGAFSAPPTAEEFRAIAGFEIPAQQIQKQLRDAAISPDAAMQWIAADEAGRCLSVAAARRPPLLQGGDAVIPVALINQWVADKGVGKLSRPSKRGMVLARVALTASSCTGWDQALAWAFLKFESEARTSSVRQCAMNRNANEPDPAALYVSMELGMPVETVRTLAARWALEGYTRYEWRPVQPGDQPMGNGTIQGSLQLANLFRMSGVSPPSWLALGAERAAERESSRDGQGGSAGLPLLCVETQADCGALVSTWKRSHATIERLIDWDSDLESMEGVRIYMETEPEKSDLNCSGLDVDRLYSELPQTFGALAELDKACWQRLSVDSAALDRRLVDVVSRGQYEDAEALMMYASLSRPVAEVKEMKVRVSNVWQGTLATIEEQRGSHYLHDVAPLRLVLFDAHLKEW